MADKNRIEPQPPISQVFENVPTNRTVETADYIILNINGRDIGLVQEVSPTQERPVHWIYEISNIQPVEAVPGRYLGRLTLSRIMAYYSELMDVMGYARALSDVGLVPEDPTAIYNLAYTVAPIDIMLKFKLPNDMIIQVVGSNMLTDNRIITKTYRECWITDLRFSVRPTDDRTVVETMTFQYRDIIQNALRPASNSTEFGAPVQVSGAVR